MIDSFNECSFPIASHDLNGFFNYLNKAALLLFKVTLDQVIGQPTTMTAPESEQKERNQLLNQVNFLQKRKSSLKNINLGVSFCLQEILRI